MVHTLNPKTGEVLWTYTSRSRFEASPVVVGDRVFVGTTDGKILALNLQTGEKNWEFVTGSGFVASPSVANGCLVIGTTDGTLYCFGKAAE
jgi:outer membrane protein assembly factor BamB